MMENQRVWVPDNSAGFIRGTITDLTTDGVSVQLCEGSRGSLSVSYDRLYPAELTDNKDVEDNCALMYLNEATLLNNIRLRYQRDCIYTYVANILIAVNPYKEMASLFSPGVIQSYRGKSLGVLPPHVFAIADKALRDMKVMKRSQSVVVSGESGAGKTESTKYILRYLCDSCANTAGPVEARLLEANPILESFGNAKTTRNNNSSRFGKFIEVHFGAAAGAGTGGVVGGFISHYLLERSRVVGQAQHERNYHVFYQLCAGAPHELRHKLRLSSPDHFHYLRGGCTQYFLHKRGSGGVEADRLSADHGSKGALYDPMLDDARDFLTLDKALATVGLSDNERLAVYTTVAAVLHLGNVAFSDDTNDSKGGCEVAASSEPSLAIAAMLMGVDADDLRQALLSRVMQTSKGGVKGTVIMVPLKVHEASSARDALAKGLYSRLFDYIVNCINGSIPFSSSLHYIGVLDIAGFEYFTVNSFEQFCINYCNEKLQQFFNQRILKDEQVLYDKEGLDVKHINYVDNQDAIELIETRGGILYLLDEEAKLPRPSFTHFTQAVHAGCGDKFRLALPRKSKLRDHREIRDDEGFLVRHFAGAVCYHTAKFLEKNNDALHDSLEGLLHESRNRFLQGLFSRTSASKSNGVSRTGNSRKLAQNSVGSKFKEQLTHLMEKLNSTGTSFVRCIKPNDSMVEAVFEGGSILSQLQCSGMTSVLQLMQQGFPSRAAFNELYNMYSRHLPPPLARLDPRLFCKMLFRALGLSDTDFRFGLTRVFFRPGKFAEFDQLMRSDAAHLASLVARVRHWLLVSRWKQAQWCSLAVIKLNNKILYRRAHLVLLQAHARGMLARKRHQHRYRAVAKVSAMRSVLTKMTEIVAMMKGDSSASQRQVAQLNSATDTLIVRMRNEQMSRQQTDLLVSELSTALTDGLAQLQNQLSRQREAQQEQARLQALQQKMHEEEERALEQQRQQQQEQLVKQQRQELEQRRRHDEQLHVDQASLHNLSLTDTDVQRRQQCQMEQERRDYELALRLADESRSGGVDLPQQQQQQQPLKRSSLVNQQRAESAVGKKHELCSWKYSELRDIINTSCDIQLLEACRAEFHRRLKVYHSWKANNRRLNGGGTGGVAVAGGEKGGQDAVMEEDQRAPNWMIQSACSTSAGGVKCATAVPAAAGGHSPPTDRYFRIPFVRPGVSGGAGNQQARGWWYAHFNGQWIMRQMEVHPHRSAVLLTAGKDSMQMCELSLEETGLTRKRGAEILALEFEREWKRHWQPVV